MRRLALTALVFTATATAHAAPVELRHQGRLLDASGAPVSGVHDVRVSLWDDPAAGAERWFELDADVAFTDGVFTVTLGDGTPLPAATLTTWPALWLQVAVDGQALGPREKLVSVPFARAAGVADGIRVLGLGYQLTCTVDGALVYDTDGGALRVCVSGAWTPAPVNTITLVGGARQWADGSAAASCDEYRHPTGAGRVYAGDVGDGLYRIDPSGSAPITAQCDMTADGGGWTRFWWFESGASMSGVTDVLSGALVDCAPDATTCFAPMPITDPAELLVRDGGGLWAAWRFDSANTTSNHVKNALVSRTQVFAANTGHSWHPYAQSSGLPFNPYNCGSGCDSFYYSTQGGILSFYLDDDTGWALTAFGAGGDNNAGIGVDSFESNTYRANSTSRTLRLYYR